MAGGKKKAARQKQTNKYGKYRDGGHRERNKARRIVKDIRSRKNPDETAYVILERYAEVCKHPKADNVVANVKRALNKCGITPKAPEKNEDNS